MDILIMVISAGLTVFFLMWFILSALDLERPRYVVLGKRNIFYLIETAGIFIITIFKPKTELDRQIADEEKEIKFLTEQKAKINKLERLKRKKDSLYQEVNDEPHAVAIDLVPHMKILKDEFNKEYEDEMFALSKSDDPEIRKKAIAELKKSNHILGSVMELNNDRRERLDKKLKEAIECSEQKYEKARKENEKARKEFNEYMEDSK